MFNLKKKWLDGVDKIFSEKYNAEIASIEKSYQDNYALRRQEFENRSIELSYKEKELELLAKRGEELKVELGQTNASLREQIKLIEAKARPDSVWVQAFTAGFTKAWDTMWSLVSEQVDRVKEKLKEEASNEAIGSIETEIQRRMDASGKVSLKPVNVLIAKKEEFEARLSTVKSESDRLKYHYYIEALEWALDGNTIHKT